VDVFYDVAGNVIFYSDGEKVWDFGHAPIQIDPTGVLSSLGGDKNASQSTLIIPYPNPEQPTARSLFYIFTSEVKCTLSSKILNAGLSTGTSYHLTGKLPRYRKLLQITCFFLKPPNRWLVFQEVDKSFVAFKEMGSGRYRVHKIDENGIHAPKFSEEREFYAFQQDN